MTALRRLSRLPAVHTAVGALLVAAYLFPVYWMVATSLKRSSDVFSPTPQLVPNPVVLTSYLDAVVDNPGLLRGILNSAVIALGTLLLTFVLGVPAAYGLARLRLRFSSVFAMVLLVAQMLPTISLALPFFVLMSRVGLVDTYLALILANTTLALPFAIIVLRPHFLAVPGEIVEAATVDGCGRFEAFWRVALPLVRPGLVTVAALSFVTAWGEFVFGLTLATSEELQPATVVLNRFIGQFHTNWNDLMAAATVTALPVIVLFAALQRFVVSGLVAGATKD